MGEKDLQMMRLRQSDHSMCIWNPFESLDESVEPQDKMYEQSDIDVSTLLIVHDESIIMEHKIFSIFNPVLWKKKKVKIVHAWSTKMYTLPWLSIFKFDSWRIN